MAWLWLGIGVLFAIVEVFSAAFVLVMLAAGAFAAAAVAAAGLPWYWQVLTFSLVSAAALITVRPAIRRRMDAGDEDASNGVIRMEGSLGLVLERVDPDHGLVKIEGEMWSARPYDATQVIEKGERVRVIEVKGATALVWRE